jgi:hypothetical protein
VPFGEILAETVAQIVMEAGGEVIHRRYGWQGCVLTVAMVIAVIAMMIWTAS